VRELVCARGSVGAVYGRKQKRVEPVCSCQSLTNLRVCVYVCVRVRVCVCVSVYQSLTNLDTNTHTHTLLRVPRMRLFLSGHHEVSRIE
jgi:hypothetical protein